MKAYINGLTKLTELNKQRMSKGNTSFKLMFTTLSSYITVFNNRDTTEQRKNEKNVCASSPSQQCQNPKIKWKSI